MLFKRYLQVDRYGFFENSLYLTTLRGGGGGLLTTDLALLRRDFVDGILSYAVL